MLLATGIIGAIVMSQAYYLHASLAAGRMPAETDAEKRRALHHSSWEALGAPAIAAVVVGLNLALLAITAGIPIPGLGHG